MTETGKLKSKGLIDIKLLALSLRRWRLVLSGEIYNPGRADCPLCQVYFPASFRLGEFKNACLGCPIYEHTGRTGCEGTPYDDFFLTDKYHAASKEVDFLSELLNIHVDTYRYKKGC